MRCLMLVLAAIALLLTFPGCKPSAGTPQKITWELRKGSTLADIGWHPKDDMEVDIAIKGDIDFTFIAHGADGIHVFHQHCWMIGAFRDPPPHDQAIGLVYAHFAQD